MSAQSDERTFGQAVELLRRIGQSLKMGRQALQWILNNFAEVEDWVIAQLKLTLLPLFAASLEGWKVIEDGEAVDDDGSWVDGFFAGMSLACLHQDSETYLTGEELVKRIRPRMGGRREFDQHILDWLFRHWDDPRIPTWFKEAVEGGDIYVVATGTVILDPDGRRCVLYLFWGDGRLYWRCRWLGFGDWDRRCRGLVPSDS
ncbi:MAG: hypothetical protein Q7S64_01285 [bacterium]|nr:hypothetical protein [bacterium]